MMAAYGATAGVLTDSGPRPVSRGLRRLALLYVWIAVASIGIVVSDPAPYDALMMGAAVLLPVLGLAPFTRGIALYLLLWAAIIAGGFVATTQATSVDVPASHMGITLYLAVTSAALAAFVASRPASNVRLIMSAYVVSALVAAVAGLVGYFNLLPGAYDLFTEYGRARGTFKDANVLGAFLVPALLYAFNVVLTGRFARASLWMAAMPILLFGVLLGGRLTQMAHGGGEGGDGVGDVVAGGGHGFFCGPGIACRIVFFICVQRRGAPDYIYLAVGGRAATSPPRDICPV
jgi:hypothetical protein